MTADGGRSYLGVQLASSLLMHLLLLLPVLIMPVGRFGIGYGPWNGHTVSLVPGDAGGDISSFGPRQIQAVSTGVPSRTERHLLNSIKRTEVRSSDALKAGALDMKPREVKTDEVKPDIATIEGMKQQEAQPREDTAAGDSFAEAEAQPPAVEMVVLDEDGPKAAVEAPALTAPAPIAHLPAGEPSDKADSDTKGQNSGLDTVASETLPNRSADPAYTAWSLPEQAVAVSSRQQSLPAESPVKDVQLPGNGRAHFTAELRPSFRRMPEPRLKISRIENPAPGRVDAGMPPGDLTLPIPDEASLKVRVTMREGRLGDISMNMIQKPFPAATGRRQRAKGKAVRMEEELQGFDYERGGKPFRLFALAKAERGRYTIAFKKEADAPAVVDISFLFFKGAQKIRVREYMSLKIESGSSLEFRFIIPAAVFWDEDERFSGAIEDSDSITKFNEDAGLVWTEEKQD